MSETEWVFLPSQVFKILFNMHLTWFGAKLKDDCQGRRLRERRGQVQNLSCETTSKFRQDKGCIVPQRKEKNVHSKRFC